MSRDDPEYDPNFDRKMWRIALIFNFCIIACFVIIISAII